MTFVRGILTAVVCVAALLAFLAYRRSGQTGRPWRESLFEVLQEWNGCSLANRARLAVINGERAADLEEQQFDRAFQEAAVAASGC